MNAWKTYLPRLSTPGTIAFLGALVLISLTVVVVLYQQHGYRSQKLREVVAQSEVLGASVTAALVFDDAKAAQDYVSALGAYPGLEVAAVYDASHRLVASISRDNAGGAPATVRVHSPYFSGDRIYVTSPVLQGSTQVGEVYMRVRVDSPAQRVVRFAGIVLLVSMAILMLSALGMTQQALKRANLELQKEMAERARAEEALRQSQKMEALGQLAGGIAHDFNNLLAIIKSSLQLMQRRIGPAAQDVQRFMDAALDAVNRAASVTERVLVFSRRQTLSPQPTDLNDLVLGLVGLIRQSVGNGVRVDVHLNATWPVLCDANQMETVILNLAVNARDAMPEGGTLRISSRDVRLREAADVPDGDYVRIDVRDTGTGMTEEVRSRAFDPFYTTKPQGKGTGLGLSMTMGFVNQSDGHLRIDTAPGKGTAIIIFMPKARDPAETEDP